MATNRASLVITIVFFCLLIFSATGEVRAQEKLKQLKPPLLSKEMMQGYIIKEAELQKDDYNPDSELLHHREYWERWESKDGKTLINVNLYEFNHPKGPEELAYFIVKNNNLGEDPDRKLGEKTWVRMSFNAEKNEASVKILFSKGKMLAEVSGFGPHGEKPPYLPDFIESLARHIETKL